MGLFCNIKDYSPLRRRVRKEKTLKFGCRYTPKNADVNRQGNNNEKFSHKFHGLTRKKKKGFKLFKQFKRFKQQDVRTKINEFRNSGIEELMEIFDNLFKAIFNETINIFLIGYLNMVN